VPSPNHDERPAGAAVELLVVHYISLPPGRFRGDAIERLFTNRLDAAAHPAFAPLGELRVSAHFLIRRDGELLQFVDADRRAWHAGVSQFDGRERCNDFSIGVELEGDGARRFTASQYRALRRLVARLRERYPLRWIAGHADIAPAARRTRGRSSTGGASRARARRAGWPRPSRWRMPATRCCRAAGERGSRDCRIRASLRPERARRAARSVRAPCRPISAAIPRGWALRLRRCSHCAVSRGEARPAIVKPVRSHLIAGTRGH